MSFRLFRRIRLAPGITLNLSKSGASVSVGPRGAKLTLGSRGVRGTAGLPGTGLFYTKKISPKTRRGKRSPDSAPTAPVKDRLTLGFFKRLVTPQAEEDFVDGCRELVEGNEGAALRYFKKSAHLADGAFTAGLLCLKHKRYAPAQRYLIQALKQKDALGKYYRKYGIQPEGSIAITEEVEARIQPDERGVLLGLVEVCQRRRHSGEAARYLERLRVLEPDDPVVLLSLVEWRMESHSSEPDTCRQVVSLTDAIENDSFVHAALLLYRARALKTLGLNDAALHVLTIALRRRKDRPEELLCALRYERAALYRLQGRDSNARKDWEKIYAVDPHYRDVAKRLGMKIK